MSLSDAIQKKIYIPSRQEVRYFRSPGRINIIGEHTDYNLGFVFPACIDKAIYFAASKLDRQKIDAAAVDLEEEMCMYYKEFPEKTTTHWQNCLIGVYRELLKRNTKPGGLQIRFAADLPIGAGVSSSSALCCGLAFIYNELYELGLNRMQIAEIARDAERNTIGIQCGFMDQFIICHAQENSAILLDCKSLEYEQIEMPAWPCQFLLINSNVPHSLHDSDYNVRRKECESVVSKIKEQHIAIDSLRDLSYDELNKWSHLLNASERKRALFVMQENERVWKMKQSLQKSDADACGRLLYQSHQGLSREYEVSCPETDFLADEWMKYPGVWGARMIGGGFGGCLLGLIDIPHPSKILEELDRKYHSRFGLHITPIRFQLAGGLAEINI